MANRNFEQDSSVKYTPQHIRRGLIANKHGAMFIVPIIRACVKYDVPLAAGFSLIEKETGFRNVWGHDPAVGEAKRRGFKYSGGIDGLEGQVVIKQDYLRYKANRATLGYQGVGPGQLTWGPTQDIADKRGGSWNPTANIDVAIQAYAGNYHAQLKLGANQRVALQVAAARYNGSGPAAEQYGRDFMVLFDKWYNRLK